MPGFERMTYEPRVTPDHLHVRLLTVDYIPQLDSVWTARDVRSSHWRLYINSAPGAFVTVSGREYPIDPLQVYLIPAWVCFDCRNETTLAHFFIHFDIVGWPPGMIRDVFPRPIQLPKRAAHTGLYQSIMKLLREGRQQSPETLSFAKAMVYLSLGEIIPTHVHENRWEIFLRGPTDLSPALRYIDSHLPEQIFNTQLAKLCYMSESHFSREFRSTLGQPPAQYVRERRVARAAEQLALTNAKLDDIARQCGFANRFYFTRAFTAVMGMPPARYRARAI